MDQLTLKRPDDWHLHLRDGAAMASVLADTARCFGRAVSARTEAIAAPS
jgi:dihydroorotase